MKILWITNIILPQAAHSLGRPGAVVGGWMQSAADELAKDPDINLAVATTYNGNTLWRQEIDHITYYLLPCKNPMRYDKTLEHYWQEIQTDFKPDLVHIHGTEFPLGLAYVNACGNRHVVVSIQGILAECVKHYYGGISPLTLMLHTTLHDIAVGTVGKARRTLQRRSRYEHILLEHVEHVIGRTSWDRETTARIHPNRQYHFCNETLRKPFYDAHWDYNGCVSHSIFAVGQANMPLKGIHWLLQALPDVLLQYPDTTVRIAGDKVMPTDFRHHMAYGQYLRHLICKHHLQNHVTFLGALSAEQMVNELMQANTFVLPSSVENSPNALCEAQILGVPCVAAHVGGVADLIPSNSCGLLYNYNDTKALSQAICQSFKTANNFDNTTMRCISRERHNPATNHTELMQIYHSILYNA